MKRLNTQRSSHCQRGLTRAEVLIIVVIVTIIGLYIGSKIGRRLHEAQLDKIHSDFDRIGRALQQYKLDNQQYPPQPPGLQALLRPDENNRSSWSGPYLSRENLLLDPWKRPYFYRASNSPPSFEVSTLGADGVEGGQDEDADIRLSFQSAARPQ